MPAECGGQSVLAMKTGGKALVRGEHWVLSSTGCAGQHVSRSLSLFILTTLPVRYYLPHLPEGDMEAQSSSVTCQGHRALSSRVGIHLQVKTPRAGRDISETKAAEA